MNLWKITNTIFCVLLHAAMRFIFQLNSMLATQISHWHEEKKKNKTKCQHQRQSLHSIFVSFGDQFSILVKQLVKLRQCFVCTANLPCLILWPLSATNEFNGNREPTNWSHCAALVLLLLIRSRIEFACCIQQRSRCRKHLVDYIQINQQRSVGDACTPSQTTIKASTK